MSVVVVRPGGPLALRIVLVQEIESLLRELGGLHIYAPEAGRAHGQVQSLWNRRGARVLVCIGEDLANEEVGRCPDGAELGPLRQSVRFLRIRYRRGERKIRSAVQ